MLFRSASGAAEVACLRKEANLWEGIITQKLVGEARGNDTGKRGVAAAIEEAARAMRVSRDKTCGFIRRHGVNTNPMSVARCELDATAGFAMTIYNWLYTP